MTACASAAIFGTTDHFCELVSSFFACIPPQQQSKREKRSTVLEEQLVGYFHILTTKSACFTFGGDAGGRLGGGGRVSVGRGFSAPGRGFGAQRGGEGVDVRGVGDVAQLVLCLGIIKKGARVTQSKATPPPRWILPPRPGARYLVWAAVVHPVLPMAVEAAGTPGGGAGGRNDKVTKGQRSKFPLHLLLNPTSVFHSAA